MIISVTMHLNLMSSPQHSMAMLNQEPFMNPTKILVNSTSEKILTVQQSQQLPNTKIQQLQHIRIT